jgi:uncharacterized membrane protein YedE/YeeE
MFLAAFGLGWFGEFASHRLLDSIEAVIDGIIVLESNGDQNAFGLPARCEQPILAKQGVLPTKTAVDRQLVIGSVLLGIGWGLVGLCPGPALENLAILSPRVQSLFST